MTLAVGLRLVESRLPSEADDTRELLGAAQEQLAEALLELRELARGIHPAVLTDRGLGPAVEGLAGRSPVPLEVIALPERRLPSPIEAAAYYIVAEAVTNVAKYAHLSHVTVAVRPDGDHMIVEVADDGVGGADPASGTGLRGIADRVEALHGHLVIDSPVGGGTRLIAEIPIQRAEVGVSGARASRA